MSYPYPDRRREMVFIGEDVSDDIDRVDTYPLYTVSLPPHIHTYIQYASYIP